MRRERKTQIRAAQLDLENRRAFKNRREPAPHGLDFGQFGHAFVAFAQGTMALSTTGRAAVGDFYRAALHKRRFHLSPAFSSASRRRRFRSDLGSRSGSAAFGVLGGKTIATGFTKSCGATLSGRTIGVFGRIGDLIRTGGAVSAFLATRPRRGFSSISVEGTANASTLSMRLGNTLPVGALGGAIGSAALRPKTASAAFIAVS
jgi:hypothetical protein